MERVQTSLLIGFAVDEKINITDTGQLSVFILGVESDLCITEELLGIQAMRGTTMGKDIFEEVSNCVNDIKLPWDKPVGLTTDGTPAMRGEKSGLVGRMQEKMWQES